MLTYTVIHGCDPNKYKPGEIVEILPPDPKGLRLNGVCRLINSDRRLSKRRLDGDQASKPVECTTCDTH